MSCQWCPFVFSKCIKRDRCWLPAPNPVSTRQPASHNDQASPAVTTENQSSFSAGVSWRQRDCAISVLLTVAADLLAAYAVFSSSQLPCLCFMRLFAWLPDETWQAALEVLKHDPAPVLTSELKACTHSLHGASLVRRLSPHDTTLHAVACDS